MVASLQPGGGYTVPEVCLWNQHHVLQCEVMDRFPGTTYSVNPFGLFLIVALMAFLCWYLYYDRMQRANDSS